ncbi:MAG: hypothetical protein ACK48O_01500 [Flavobacteriia bacterium]|jgi:hypothetical protein
MTRLLSVLKITLLGFLFINIIMAFLLLIDSYSEGTKMQWDYLVFMTIYGVIVSVILGYLDRPVLEKRIILGITIGSVIMGILSFLIDNQTLLNQALYLFFGVVIGRRVVVLADLFLKKASK